MTERSISPFNFDSHLHYLVCQAHTFGSCDTAERDLAVDQKNSHGPHLLIESLVEVLVEASEYDIYGKAGITHNSPGYAVAHAEEILCTISFNELRFLPMPVPVV